MYYNIEHIFREINKFLILDEHEAITYNYLILVT